MKKRIKTIIFMAVMIILIPLLSVRAATPVRDTDVDKPADGYTFLMVRGNFHTLPKQTILDRINAIRKEACQEGLINPSTGEKLTEADYSPIKWSSDLEWIAQTRAAEASLAFSHKRPNGDMCFSCTHYGVSTWAENIALNMDGIMTGINQWYSEKSAWVDQDESAVTGHYTSMIDPQYSYIAVGCFRLEAGGPYTVSGELSFVPGLDEAQIGTSGLYDQKIEIPVDQKDYWENWIEKQKEEWGEEEKPNQSSGESKTPWSYYVNRSVEKIKISGISHQIAAGKSVKLTATVLPKYADNKKLLWSSSNTRIATVSQTGKVKIKKGVGGKSVTITVKATDGSGKKASFKIKIMKGAVKSIKIKAARKTLKAGKKLRLKATVKVAKGKPVNKKVKWTSSNKKYATVSSKGVVKALKSGKGKKVKITAMATDGTGKKKVVTIKIK